MPRRSLIRHPFFPYHVTIRCNNKEWFDVPMPKVWEFCQYSLSLAFKKYPIRLHAFVLMTNHYHMLLSTPDSNLDKFMFEFNRTLSKLLRKQTGRINRIFGDRYHWCLIEKKQYWQNCLRYVYENPLRAGLESDLGHYPFSTFYYLKNKMSFSISLESFFGENEISISIIENSKLDYPSCKLAPSKPIFKLPSVKTLRNHM